MRAWVKLFSFERRRPVNNIVVFETIRDEREERDFFEETICTPYIRGIMAKSKDGWTDRLQAQFIQDKGVVTDDYEWLEYCVVFSRRGKSHMDVQVELLADGKDDLSTVTSMDVDRPSTWGVMTLICESYHEIHRMLEEGRTLAKIYARIEAPLHYEFSRGRTERHVRLV